MFVIEVIPLVRGTILESLSYFSSQSYEIGSFVAIPIRGKTGTGLVINQKPVSSTKTALKAATFSLRKLPIQKDVSVLPPQLLNTVTELQSNYPATKGSILHSLLPPDVRNGTYPYPKTGATLSAEDPTPTLIIAPKDERFINYHSIVRSAFAHRGSVMLVVPHTEHLQQAIARLSTGIADRIISFHSHQTKKEREAAYAAFSNMSHTVLIITTPSFAYLDREDITHYIIEDAGSASYLRHERPYLDDRLVLIMLARQSGRACYIGDVVLPTEYEHYRREDIYQSYAEPQKRLTLTAPLSIVVQKDGPKGEVPFQLFSPELKARITTTLERRRTVFLYAARRGLAPVVACIDCGHIFRCPDSGSPYSLLRTVNKTGNEERWFISGTSGKRVRAADTCTMCGSWRLRERGIGIQHIHDECRKLFPDTPITIFDHTTATTYKKALMLKKTISNQKGAILIGTQMVMPFLPDPIDLAAIVSLDAVRAIPTWRADEQLFRLLISLREQTDTEVIVQTRNEPDDLLIYASKGALERFYDDEISLRQMMQYPPFATFILCSWQGNPTAVKQAEQDLRQRLTGTKLTGEYYNNPHSTNTKVIRHCLFRLPNKDQDLINRLRTLPPYFTITVNPDRIV
jgi:primosomal protein N'